MTIPSAGTVPTLLTASEVHGTGADTTTLGTGTPGHIPHGITTAGTAHGIQDGMTLGTTAASMILGITAMQDGMEVSITIITADGTVVGTHSGTDTIRDITRDIIRGTHLITSTPGEAQDTKQDRTGCLQAGRQAAQASALHQHQEETLYHQTAELFRRTHLPAQPA